MSYQQLLMGIYEFHTGGAETLAKDLAIHLRGKGIEVSFMATHGGFGPISDQLQELGFACHIVQSESLNPLARRKRIFDIFRLVRPEIFHAHHFALFRYCYYSAKFGCSPISVVTEHTDYEFLREKTYADAARFSLKKAQVSTVVHKKMIESLQSISEVDLSRVHVIENGVDTERFKPDPDSRFLRDLVGARDDEVLIGFVGRLHYQKNVPGLIRSFAEVVTDCPSARLVIVGDGPDESELKKQVDDADLSHRVNFLGRRENIPEILSGFDIFALPSLTEGLPLALLEAMSTGLPTVATDVGANADILDASSGILVEPNDSTALTAAFRELVEDRSRRVSMSEQARKIVETRFVQANCLQKYHELFTRLSESG